MSLSCKSLIDITKCSICNGEGLEEDGISTVGTCEICYKVPICHNCVGTEEFHIKFDSCEECFIVACKKCLILEDKGSYCAPCLKECIRK